MPYSIQQRNDWLDAFEGAYASLHTNDPGDDGSNEVTGGSPAYARIAISFDSADAGTRASSSAPEFDVPGSTTVKFVGFWDLATGGSFVGGGAVTNETFATQGKYTLQSATLDLNLTA